MSELLIKAQNASAVNPATDAMCYKTGDVVVVMDDGHMWGSEEGPPVFEVVKMSGVPRADLEYLTAEQPQSLADVTPAVMRKMPKLLQMIGNAKARPMQLRRRHRVDLQTNTVTDKLRT